MTKKIDLVGQRFGRLTVVGEAGRNKHGKALWECLCDCGSEIVTVGTLLRTGHTKSCGCLQRDKASKANFKCLLNQKFGRLTVIEELGRSSRRLVLWRCLCECGRYVEVRGVSLRTGSTKSCGCLNIENIIQRNRKHGLTQSSEYKSWQGMKARCYNPKNRKYYRYGARGIKVQESWINDFEAFYNHIGPKPSPKHTVHRIDNDGDYCEGNVVWATSKVQARVKSNNRLLTLNGKTQCMADWAEELNMTFLTLHGRLDRGWSVEEALLTPVGGKRKSKQEA